MESTNFYLRDLAMMTGIFHFLGPMMQEYDMNFFKVQVAQTELAQRLDALAVALDSRIKETEGHFDTKPHLQKLVDTKKKLLDIFKLVNLIQDRINKANKVVNQKYPQLSNQFDTFGVPLSLLLKRKEEKNNKCPRLVTILLQEIRKRGLGTEGIFRISGQAMTIRELQLRFDDGEENIDFSPYTVNDLTTLLKQFLRDLPEPVCADLYTAFVECSGIPGVVKRVTALKSVLLKLPKENYDLLDAILEISYDVTRLEAQNLMGTKNMAIIVGLNVFREKQKDSQKLLQDTDKILKVTETLISYYPQFFKNEPLAEDLLNKESSNNLLHGLSTKNILGQALQEAITNDYGEVDLMGMSSPVNRPTSMLEEQQLVNELSGGNTDVVDWLMMDKAGSASQGQVDNNDHEQNSDKVKSQEEPKLSLPPPPTKIDDPTIVSQDNISSTESTARAENGSKRGRRGGEIKPGEVRLSAQEIANNDVVPLVKSDEQVQYGVTVGQMQPQQNLPSIQDQQSKQQENSQSTVSSSVITEDDIPIQPSSEPSDVLSAGKRARRGGNILPQSQQLLEIQLTPELSQVSSENVATVTTDVKSPISNTPAINASLSTASHDPSTTTTDSEIQTKVPTLFNDTQASNDVHPNLKTDNVSTAANNDDNVTIKPPLIAMEDQKQ